MTASQGRRNPLASPAPDHTASPGFHNERASPPGATDTMCVSKADDSVRNFAEKRASAR